MSASRLADLLAGGLPHRLAAHAQTLLDLQTRIERALPAALVGHVRVRALDNGVLSLACASGAAASRLRQQTDALAAALDKQGIAVARIRMAVDPALLAAYVPAVAKPGLPPAALTDLSRLEAGIEDGPLKDALGRLLRHHAPERK